VIYAKTVQLIKNLRKDDIVVREAQLLQTDSLSVAPDYLAWLTDRAVH